MVRSLLILVLALVAAPSRAGETAWHELVPGSTVRLITSGAMEADGTLWAAFELRMPEGTNTYWHTPGETGIPTRITLEGEAQANVHWPMPTRQTDTGYLDYVYHDHLVLPFVISGATPGQTLSAEIALGLCADICVPARAKLSLGIEDAQPDAANRLRIAQALARAPIAWDGDGSAIAEVGFDAQTQTVTLSGVDPRIDPASIIIYRAGADTLFSRPRARPGAQVLFDVLDAEHRLAPSVPLDIVFATTQGPYRVRAPIANAR